MNQVVSKFDVMMAQMREDAQQCNLRCGLNRYPKLPDTGIKPVGYAGPRPPKAYVVERRDKVGRMVNEGFTSPEIARNLRVSIDTVKSDCHFLRQEGRLPEIKPGYRLSAAQKIRRAVDESFLSHGRPKEDGLIRVWDQVAAQVGRRSLRLRG